MSPNNCWCCWNSLVSLSDFRFSNFTENQKSVTLRSKYTAIEFFITLMHTSLVVLHLSRGTKSESRLSIIFAVPCLLQSGCYRWRVIKWNESFEGLSRKIKGKRNRLNLNYKENIFFAFKLMPNLRELSKQLSLFYCYQTRVFDSPANVSDCVSFFFFHKARPQKLWLVPGATFIGKNLSLEYLSSFPKWKWNVSIRSK